MTKSNLLIFLGIFGPGEYPETGALGVYRDRSGSWWLWQFHEASGPYETQADAEQSLLPPTEFHPNDPWFTADALAYLVAFLIFVAILMTYSVVNGGH